MKRLLQSAAGAKEFITAAIKTAPRLGHGHGPVHHLHPFYLVCAGADDPFIPPSAREKFIELMTAVGADWQLIVYSGAGHSFTDKWVDGLNLPGFKYHAPTDARSWAAMRNLFDECFGRV